MVFLLKPNQFLELNIIQKTPVKSEHSSSDEVLGKIGKSDVDRYSTAEARESLSGNNVVKKHVHIRVEEGNILLKCDDCGYETTERYKIKREV